MESKLSFTTVVVALCCTFPACATVRGDAPASVNTSISAASAYWFRGAPLNERGALQGSLAVGLPLANGDTVSLSSWANMDVSDNSGDAVFPDGNGNQFSEVDLVATYTRSFENLQVSLGVLSYNFPNLVDTSTHELSLSASGSLGPVGLSASLYYDVDVLEDFYLSLAANRGFTLAGPWSANLNAQLGYMGSDQAAFYLGVAESAFSDLSAGGSLSYAYDPGTSLSLSASYVSLVDSDFRDAADAAGLDDSSLIVSLGVAWSF